MRTLVTGGAGYIGSFMTRLLLDRGHDVVVFDNLERGHKEYIDQRAVFYQGDIKNISDVDNVFKNHRFDVILHFAAYISVGESESDPKKYHANNVIGSKNLFNIAIKNSTNKIIFSSSAAVYGNPEKIPIPETHPKNPTSEYGKNKLAMEDALTSIQKENSQLRFICLRYFNAAGAALDGSMGEDHRPETHIIPKAINAALSGSTFKLFGTDYNTNDGTCVRDYIHILDLVKAHILSLEKLDKEDGGYFYNVGTGIGYSNKEVLDMVEKVSGHKIKILNEERRKGDANQLIADPTKINQELKFKPEHSSLKTIIETAWQWHTRKAG